jgi:hypothetical protein
MLLGKNDRSDIHFVHPSVFIVQTSSSACFYPRVQFYPRTGFYYLQRGNTLSARTRTVSVLMRAPFAWTQVASAQTCDCVHVDAKKKIKKIPVRTDAGPVCTDAGPVCTDASPVHTDA